MLLGEVALELVDDELRCSVDVEPEVEPSRGAFRLVVAVPRRFAGLVDARASAFGPLAAAVCGEPAPIAEERSAPVAGWLGLAYDGGVDAAATLVDPPGRVTHLLTVADLGAGPACSDDRQRGISALAEQRGLGFLPVATNARELARDRDRSDELALAWWDALMVCLPAFAEIVVPAPRPDALATAARYPYVLRHVVFCTEPDAPPGCGRCTACVLALTELDVLGVAPPDGQFAETLTADAVDAVVEGGTLADVLEVVAGIPDDRPWLLGTWTRALARRLERRSSSRWSSDAVVRVARAAARSGARLPDDAQFGWGEGEVPLRVEHEARHGLVRTVATRGDRAVPWTMVDAYDDGAGAPWCAVMFDRSWGRGLVTGYGADDGHDGDARARMLRAAGVRVWWRDDGGLDAARVLETLEHGCLPLQAMPERAADLVRQGLPARLRDLVVGVPAAGPERLDDAEIDRRLHDAVAELVAGSLERDLLASGATP